MVSLHSTALVGCLLSWGKHKKLECIYVFMIRNSSLLIRGNPVWWFRTQTLEPDFLSYNAQYTKLNTQYVICFRPWESYMTSLASVLFISYVKYNDSYITELDEFYRMWKLNSFKRLSVVPEHVESAY